MPFVLFALLFVGSLGAVPAPDPVLPPEGTGFSEVWAYLMAGEEASWNADQPVTDLAYFSASLNSWGELSGIPDAAKLKAFPGRKHLVVALLDNSALTHLVLHPLFPVRNQLLDDLVRVAGPYDGLQLDFESVTSRDKESFWSFLAELKMRLGGKLLGVAVPARTTLIEDAYDYRLLDRTVDRVVVMAYDEHWSGGAPGPVASLDCCRRVAKFAQTAISPSKLVMGMPFYGRAWTDKSLARAYRATAINRLLEVQKTGPLHRTDGVPDFSYEETVKVRVFFDDRESHRARLNQYAGLGVRNVSFWRLGQESPDFWGLIRVVAPPPAVSSPSAF